MLLGELVGSALAAEDAPRAVAASPLLDFDIPVQPLNAALNRYAEISGQPALFPSDIIGLRTSTAVRGRFSAEAALQMMLQGTGLVAEKRSSGLGHTFVLKEVAGAASTPRDGLQALFSEEGYAGLLQARVWKALCANGRTRPGDYSALLRFHLGADGRIGDVRLIGTSGEGGRDAALLDTLRGVHIDRRPPAAIVRRALTMRIAPAVPSAGPQCDLG
ncbi:Ferric-pseudobactin 358 receptor precursor [Variovorax boronicumulans]|uniref:secretin and TonB N-terminal domain-containing protein n=1 Tax=Variovorax boronicumulans TaxID=436515 RepID=UPI0011805C31|nr:secretin and TonB N-terminal domain-containing protein [Variovorax boronicumulans]PBI85524.1 Ferric-pseudobactin 358 receptor precursor [Variovorax boronicumulans]